MLISHKITHILIYWKYMTNLFHRFRRNGLIFKMHYEMKWKETIKASNFFWCINDCEHALQLQLSVYQSLLTVNDIALS